MATPIGAVDYYDGFPTNDHTPGDVWAHFPTFGILPMPTCSALIVTPACDLANRKVETLTYIPILPVQQFLASRDHLGDIVRTTEGQLTAAGTSIPLRASSSGQLQVGDVDAARTLLNDGFSGKSAKELLAKKRAEAGLILLQSILNAAELADGVLHFKTLVGDGEFSATCKRLVTNGYRTDIHFLPADGQQQTWSAIPAHSVALFRYPLTLPLALLDLSIVTAEADWKNIVTAFGKQFACAVAFQPHRPIKVLRIRPRFMSDLLTRFIALYGRLGSPDFSPGTVDTYVEQILGNYK